MHVRAFTNVGVLQSQDAWGGAVAHLGEVESLLWGPCIGSPSAGAHVTKRPYAAIPARTPARLTVSWAPPFWDPPNAQNWPKSDLLDVGGLRVSKLGRSKNGSSLDANSFNRCQRI